MIESEVNYHKVRYNLQFSDENYQFNLYIGD